MDSDDDLQMTMADEEHSVHRITEDVAIIHNQQGAPTFVSNNNTRTGLQQQQQLQRPSGIQLDDEEEDEDVDVEVDLELGDDDDDDEQQQQEDRPFLSSTSLPAKNNHHLQSTGTLGEMSLEDEVDDEVDRMLNESTTSVHNETITMQRNNNDQHQQTIQSPSKRPNNMERRKSIAEVMSESLQNSDKKFYSDHHQQQLTTTTTNNSLLHQDPSQTASQFFTPSSSAQQKRTSFINNQPQQDGSHHQNNNTSNYNNGFNDAFSTPQPTSSTHTNNANSSSSFPSKRPMTWSEKKKSHQESKQLLDHHQGSPENNNNGTNTPSPYRNNGCVVSSPFSLFMTSSSSSRNNNNSNNGESTSTSTSNPDLLIISATEEYRRMSIESRQNEERSELIAFCFSALSRLSQHLLHKSEKTAHRLETAVTKWFKRWANGSDRLLNSKLQEANDFLEEYMSQIIQQQQQNNNNNNNNSSSSKFQVSTTRDIRSPSLSSTMVNNNNTGTPQHFSLGGNSVLSPGSIDIRGGVTTTNQNFNHQQQQYYAQQQQQNNIPSSLLPSSQQSVTFTSVQNLQKALIQFSKNFEPLNAQPTSGQLRSEGIMNDMQNWSSNDFQDMSFLTAPTVLLIGPKNSGKSCVAHCLVNKKPFFSTVPKTQPTPGISCHVAHLKDCHTTAHAKMTLTTEMMDIENQHTNNLSESKLGGTGNQANSDSRNYKIGNKEFAFAGRVPFNDSLLSSRASRAQPSIKSTADDTVILRSSSHLRLIEVPQHLLSAIPPKILPLSGFEIVLTFDVTLDGTKARRELAAQFRQIAATVITALQERGETASFAPQVTIPVYLVATHVDKMKSAERTPNALAGLLRDLRLWFNFVQESVVFSNSSGGSSGTSNQQPTTPRGGGPATSSISNTDHATSSSPLNVAQLVSQYVQFYLVDVYAVSCQEWTVVGERPRSGETFHEMASDMFRTMSMLRPLTPSHVGAQIVDQFLDALSSYEETTGQTIENLEGIKTAFSIRPETSSHIACEVSVRQLIKSANNSNNNNSKFVEQLSVPTPVKRILVGVTTFFTAIGRWANSSGFFIDYALFLRLVLHHVQVKQLLEDVAIVPQKDPRYDSMSKVFSRCLQYAFVDVLSYHGLVSVDEEEGFSSVLVGPQVLTRIVNCFSALHSINRNTHQLNVTEKQADLFNENCIRKGNINGNALTDFPEIGKTDKEITSNPSEQQAVRILHEEIMRDLTSWQFGAVTPFSWRALFRGPLATLSRNDDDFFLWCCRQVAPPLGHLDSTWTPESVDLVIHPTGSHLPAARRKHAMNNNNRNNDDNSNKDSKNKVIPGPILLSTLFAKAIDSRSYQFLIASLTVADDEQQPYCVHTTFSGCPPPASLTQSFLMQLLQTAASGQGNFSIRDVAVWSNCLCFSTYHYNNNNNQVDGYFSSQDGDSEAMPDGDGSFNSNSYRNGNANNNNNQLWEYCCVIVIYWDIENNASNPSCRMVVAGISRSGSGSPPKKSASNDEDSNNNNNNNDPSSPTEDASRSGKISPYDNHQQPDLMSTSNTSNNNYQQQQQQFIVDVSHASRAIEWLKHELDQTILILNNSLTDLRPTTFFRESRLGSVTPVAFSGVAQTAREILAGCSRRTCENLVQDLQLLHEKSWETESLPLNAILKTLMLEERVGPVYQQ